MNEPIRRLSAVQKSMLDILCNYIDGKISEEEYSDEIDETILYHRNVKEDVDTYYQGLAAD